MALSAINVLAATVPASSENEKTGTINIVGEPGPGQNNRFGVVKLQLDSKGHIQEGWMGDDAMIRSTLGNPLTLEPGKYLVAYAGVLFLDLAPGENKVIHLQKIAVPKIDGGYTVQPFYDLTVPAEQQRVATNTWIYHYVATIHYTNTDADGNETGSWDESADIDQLCQGRTSGNTAQACESRQKGDLQAFIKSSMRFKNGMVSEMQTTWNKEAGGAGYVDSEQWVDYDYVNILNSAFQDGEYFSAMPGITYGLHMTNAGGESNDKLGVKGGN